ncbi:MAG: DNA-methyltransferase [Pyrinomonadaceae bacterium]
MPDTIVKENLRGHMAYSLHHADCIEWLLDEPEKSFEAIVTDPPYGLKEFSHKEQSKLRYGNRGGVWRIPPTLGGNTRSPLPRFTVLTQRELAEIHDFFRRWGAAALRVAVPGAHLFIATNPFLSPPLYAALIDAGWEKRGEIVRLVRTLKGGDRPKNAETEFHDVTVMPRSAWEPWGLFRKALEGRVQDNLRRWRTGGLRRVSAERPFTDVIASERTPRAERDIVDHPSLKPQKFMRQIVRASLPLGAGRVLDPFMGGGSTIAAAEAVGYDSVGVEADAHYYATAASAIPLLAALYPNWSAKEQRASARPVDIDGADEFISFPQQLAQDFSFHLISRKD